MKFNNAIIFPADYADEGADKFADLGLYYTLLSLTLKIY